LNVLFQYYKGDFVATFYIDDYIDFGTKGYHNATSWQVAIDPQFEKIS